MSRTISCKSGSSAAPRDLPLVRSRWLSRKSSRPRRLPPTWAEIFIWGRRQKLAQDILEAFGVIAVCYGPLSAVLKGFFPGAVLLLGKIPHGSCITVFRACPEGWGWLCDSRAIVWNIDLPMPTGTSVQSFTLGSM